MGRELPATSSACSRARPTSPAATSPCWRRCSSSPARWPITTAGGASSPSGWPASGSTSALCGLAPNMELLVVFRLLQGAAGALLVPGLAGAHHRQLRGRRHAAARSASGRPRRRRSTVLGPLVGGILVDTLSWRVAFLINVPLVARGALRDPAPRRRSRATRRRRRRFDWLGSVVIALAVGGIAFGLIRGQEHHWTDALAFIVAGRRDRGGGRSSRS